VTDYDSFLIISLFSISLLGHNGVTTLPALLLISEVLTYIEQNENNNARILILAFSGGCTHVAFVLKALPKNLHNRICAIFVGPSFFYDSNDDNEKKNDEVEIVHIFKGEDIFSSLGIFSFLSLSRFSSAFFSFLFFLLLLLSFYLFLMFFSYFFFVFSEKSASLAE